MLGYEGKLVMEEKYKIFFFNYRKANFVLKTFKPPNPSLHELKILLWILA